MKEEHAEAGMRESDAPIHRLSEDRLGRANLSRQIAESCAGALMDEGRTIGVVGEWGTGKTSCLHMAEELLAQKGIEVEVRWFNPWMWRNDESLVRELIATVAGEPREGLRWMQTLGLVAQAGAWGPSLAATAGWDEGIAAGAAGACKAIQDLTKALERGGKGNIKKLEQALDRARKASAKNRVRTVVMVDDIDRLEPRPLADLLRAVRLVGNLPNVVYVLALDVQSVAKSLKAGGHRGEEYLQKIIEIEIRVPALQPEQREALLREELEGIISWHRGGMDEDRTREMDKAVAIVGRLLSTPRQVKRYLMAMRRGMACTPKEVRASDIAILEGLKLAGPGIAEAITRHTAGLTIHEHMDPVMPQTDAMTSAGLEAVLKAAPKELRGVVKDAVTNLFPRVARLTEKEPGGSERVQWSTWRNEAALWRRQGRVAETSVLESALGYRTTTQLHLSTAQKELIASMGDRKKLEGWLLKHGWGMEHTLALIEGLAEPSYRATEEHAQAAIPVLMAALGEIEQEDWRKAISLRADMTVGRAVAKLLGMHHPGEDGSGLTRLIQEVGDIGGQARVLEWTRQCVEPQATLHREEHIEAAESDWLERVRKTGEEEAARSQWLSGAAALARTVASRKNEGWQSWSGARISRQMLRSAACESEGWASVPGEDGMRQMYRCLELFWKRLEKAYGTEDALAEAIREAQEEGPKEWVQMGDLAEVATEYLVGRRMEQFNEAESTTIRISFGDEMEAQVERLRGEQTREALCTRAVREGHLDPSVGAIRGLVPGKPTYRHDHAIRVRVGPVQVKRAERLAKDLQVPIGDVWGTTLAAGLDRIEGLNQG